MYLTLMALIGYLFGCMNGSQIVGKYKHVNIKKGGSKNAGATNTVLLVGWKYGVFVAAFDVFKAIISLYIAVSIFMHMELLLEAKMLLLYVNATFVIIGHNFPVTMHFNGGKGTASFLGVLLFIDWRFTVMVFVIFLLFALATDYFVIGTLVAYLSFIAYTAFIFGKEPTYFACLLVCIFLFKHIANFKRIVHKEERKLTSLFHKEVG